MISKITRETNPDQGNQAPRQLTAAIRVERDFGNLEGISSKIELVDQANKLAMFVTVNPKTGTWSGGTFKFLIRVPDTYPHDPPKVLYLGPSRLWHPNIEGESDKKEWGVCLNILRADWKPVLAVRDVVFGLEMMFYEPNIDDPLPGTAKEAARHLRDDPKGFDRKAKQWMSGNYVN